jgi:hypothetical protein
VAESKGGVGSPEADEVMKIPQKRGGDLNDAALMITIIDRTRPGFNSGIAFPS